jgi:uncharacterized DUF497 family protein
MYLFEWDNEKARENLAQHGIDFNAARFAFSDPRRTEDIDRRFDYGEDRWRTIGMAEGRCMLLFVAYTIRGNGTETIRIISARRADGDERRHCGNRANCKTPVLQFQRSW